MESGAPTHRHSLLWPLVRLIVPALVLLPILAGVGFALRPALMTNGAFKGLTEWPGFWQATRISLWSGVLATSISLFITTLLLAVGWGTRPFRLLTRVLSPLLSVPHAAAALGLAFLISPSGWIARIISPWVTGWTRPPDLLILNDPAALTLTLGLVLKEIPFLLLMSLAAMPQADASRRLLVAESLGAGRVQGFMGAVFPALYRQIRLPVYAVLAYSMTTVDMAQILGPTRPPSLSLQIVLWMSKGSEGDRLLATTGAMWQLFLVMAALGAWHLAERGLGAALRRFATAGVRKGMMPDAIETALRLVATGLGLTLTLGMALALAGLGVWSVAGIWNFPDALPQNLSLQVWMRGGDALATHSLTTFILAFCAAFLSLACAIIWLGLGKDNEKSPIISAMIYLPLILPQVSFLPGLQTFALHLGLKGNWPQVLWAHCLFVFPYVVLSLSPAYHAWDKRIAVIGASLGASPIRVFWTLRLPMLLRPLLTAFAVGFAVSIAQYLPTLLISGGRIETLTTEAVALSTGGNRRLIGAYALLQMILPALAFGMAVIIPAIVFANRKGMEERHV